MNEKLSRSLRVLHMPYNIGGATWRLVEAERRLGIDSQMLSFYSRYGAITGLDSGGIDLDFHRYSRAGKALKRFYVFFRYAGMFDVFHFYFGDSFLFSEDFRVSHWDIPLLARLGKKVIMTFQGCELRRKGAFLREYEHSICNFCTSEWCDERKDRARVRTTRVVQRHAYRVFVATPDLLFLVPGAEVLPQTAPWKPTSPKKYRPPASGETFRVFHCPTNKPIKGTDYLIAACERLKSEGYPVELELSEKQDWPENMRRMKRSHLVVDQLCGGWYGLVSVEAMTWGLPVVCDINDDLKQKVAYGKELPIINASFDSIYHVLRRCLENPGSLAASASHGPGFSARHHSPESLARLTARAYGAEKAC